MKLQAENWQLTGKNILQKTTAIFDKIHPVYISPGDKAKQCIFDITKAPCAGQGAYREGIQLDIR